MQKRHKFWNELDSRDEVNNPGMGVLLVDRMLRGAIELNASRIFIQKRPSPNGELSDGHPWYSLSDGGRYSYFTIDYEIGDQMQEVASTGLDDWQELISRLKVVANVVDYGPRKSVHSTFDLVIDGQKLGTYLLTSNPNPFVDSIVELEVTPARDFVLP